jgi:hypothetical protein
MALPKAHPIPLRPRINPPLAIAEIATPYSAQTTWWAFFGSILAALFLLIGVAINVIRSQRRRLNLHRSQARRMLASQKGERAVRAALPSVQGWTA